MKTTILYGFILMCSLSLLSSTCSHHDDDDGSHDDNRGEIQQVIEQAESGIWRVTSFIDSGQDETNDFNGYNFTFQSNGTVIATNDNNTLNGTWFITDSSSSSDGDIDFNMFFNVSDSNKFEDLNDDWDIVSHSEDVIRLRDISGGNGGIDTLTFERN